jgi:hypothetical protein
MHTPVGDAAVYLSYRLDPSSELGDAGYRLKLRDSKTGKTTDVSLGFSNMRPYVVVRNPNLPLLDGDIAQLAVDVRELDDTSVTFPPVALRAKRHATGKMVRCPRAALERDSDHDGLTDLEEDRLATDPSVPDTDGDGLLDGEDPAPLGAAVPSTPEQQLWVSALTQLVAKDTKDELLIVKGGPRLDVRGVRLRLLQLEDDELLLYDKRFGTRVTFDISVTMKTPDEGKVAISYGWRGEEYTATRTGAGAPWKFVAGGMWITRRDERGRSLALW